MLANYYDTFAHDYIIRLATRDTAASGFLTLRPEAPLHPDVQQLGIEILELPIIIQRASQKNLSHKNFVELVEKEIHSFGKSNVQKFLKMDRNDAQPLKDFAILLVHALFDKISIVEINNTIKHVGLTGDSIGSATRHRNKKILDSFKKKEIESFFERIYSTDTMKFFLALADYEDSSVPASFAHEARRWLKRQEQCIAEALVESPSIVPELADMTPIIALHKETENSLTVIEVKELLPDGENDDLGALGRGGEERGEENSEIRTQPRLDWVIAALKENGFDSGDMILYREKMAERYNAQSGGYCVLEVQKDHHHFQIAISEIVGNATYVIRKPIDFQDGTVVTVSDLKKTDTAFQTSCYTPAQWIRNIRTYAYTPLDELKVQLKTRMGWGDKKFAVEESFGLFYCETEQLPFVEDNTIVEHGPLAGKTTYARLYHALKRQAIPGLEHVRNYKDLRAHIFGEVITPVKAQPAAVEKPVQSFDAREVFKNAVLHVQATGTIPDLGEDFDRSLIARKVDALDEVIVGNPDNITSVRSFLLATGIAMETGDGEINPAPPVIISKFARFMGL